LIKWYERDAHQLFDVCADDHCQRYQGIARARTLLVRQAIDETRGEVLVYKGEICDARFSKSCGGVSELFESCWADEHHDYLTPVRDDASFDEVPDLSVEANAERWIRTSPDAFCNTSDQQILSQVLNQYDQETQDFYRWTVQYSTEQLSELLKKRSGIDFGTVVDLLPLERGASGRITKLKIVGTKRTLIVGKELEIRKWLSESHLHSSAFVVDKTTDGFVLTGAGWGHGVGLCQIGAAVMGAKGYTYDQILKHYFRGATLNAAY
jgi:SpoIID/LytB domain protein